MLPNSHYPSYNQKRKASSRGNGISNRDWVVCFGVLFDGDFFAGDVFAGNFFGGDIFDGAPLGEASVSPLHPADMQGISILSRLEHP